MVTIVRTCISASLSALLVEVSGQPAVLSPVNTPTPSARSCVSRLGMQQPKRVMCLLVKYRSQSPVLQLLWKMPCYQADHLQLFCSALLGHAVTLLGGASQATLCGMRLHMIFFLDEGRLQLSVICIYFKVMRFVDFLDVNAPLSILFHWLV